MSPFAIAALTVTNDQFAAFVAETGYLTQAEREGWSSVFHMLLSPLEKRKGRQVPRETPWWYPVEGACWSRPEGPQSELGDRGEHPVVYVSWDDAQAFCGWAGVSLPSEAQWEYAARGGLKATLYPWGDELTPCGAHRCNIWQGRFPTPNTAEDGYVGTAPAIAYAKNGFGLYNAVGNVWQWCADDFSPDYHRITASRDPFNRTGGNVKSMRGGSFFCHASYCDRYRYAARTGNNRRTSTSNIGFRVVDTFYYNCCFSAYGPRHRQKIIFQRPASRAEAHGWTGFVVGQGKLCLIRTLGTAAFRRACPKPDSQQPAPCRPFNCKRRDGCLWPNSALCTFHSTSCAKEALVLQKEHAYGEGAGFGWGNDRRSARRAGRDGA